MTARTIRVSAADIAWRAEAKQAEIAAEIARANPVQPSRPKVTVTRATAAKPTSQPQPRPAPKPAPRPRPQRDPRDPQRVPSSREAARADTLSPSPSVPPGSELVPVEVLDELLNHWTKSYPLPTRPRTGAR